MPSFGDWARQFPDVDRLVLARQARSEEAITDAVDEVIAQEIDHVRRADVRTAEGRVPAEFIRSFGSRLHGLFPTGASHQDVASLNPSFAKMLRKSFAIGENERVTWGQATVEQHEQRLAALSKQISGLRVTASKHKAAIDALRSSGARCLDDIATASVAA